MIRMRLSIPPWASVVGVLVLIATACTSPTEPTARVLGRLVDLEGGIVLAHDSNPDVSADQFGGVTIHVVTDGGCPVEYPDVEVIRQESHAIVLIYEVRRTRCREFYSNARVRISHLYEHVLHLAPEDGIVETLEVVALELDGRLHRSEFTMNGAEASSPTGPGS